MGPVNFDACRGTYRRTDAGRGGCGWHCVAEPGRGRELGGAARRDGSGVMGSYGAGGRADAGSSGCSWHGVAQSGCG